MNNEPIPILEAIYSALLLEGKIKSQNEFAKLIDYNSGYISRARKINEPIPHKLAIKLQSVFNVNPEYIASNGAIKPMFLSSTSIVSEPTPEYSRSTPPLEQLIATALQQQDRLISGQTALIEGQNKLINLLTEIFNEQKQ